MNKITFKKITPAELKGFFKFFKRSIHGQFPEYSPKTRKNFTKNDFSSKSLEKDIKNEGLAIYAAISGSEYVGFLMASAWRGGICYINWLAVAKNFQGKGIAPKLLRICGKNAKTKGFHKIQLWTTKRNLKFYKDQGFKLAGEIPKNLYGSSDYLFYKTLQRPIESKFLKSTKI